MWYYQDGASFIFPDAWEKYVEPIPLVSHPAFKVCESSMLMYVTSLRLGSLLYDIAFL